MKDGFMLSENKSHSIGGKNGNHPAIGRYVWNVKSKRFHDLENRNRFVARKKVEQALGMIALSEVIEPPESKKVNWGSREAARSTTEITASKLVYAKAIILAGQIRESREAVNRQIKDGEFDNSDYEKLISEPEDMLQELLIRYQNVLSGDEQDFIIDYSGGKYDEFMQEDVFFGSSNPVKTYNFVPKADNDLADNLEQSHIDKKPDLVPPANINTTLNSRPSSAAVIPEIIPLGPGSHINSEQEPAEGAASTLDADFEVFNSSEDDIVPDDAATDVDAQPSVVPAYPPSTINFENLPSPDIIPLPARNDSDPVLNSAAVQGEQAAEESGFKARARKFGAAVLAPLGFLRKNNHNTAAVDHQPQPASQEKNSKKRNAVIAAVGIFAVAAAVFMGDEDRRDYVANAWDRAKSFELSAYKNGSETETKEEENDGVGGFQLAETPEPTKTAEATRAAETPTPQPTMTPEVTATAEVEADEEDESESGGEILDDTKEEDEQGQNDSNESDNTENTPVETDKGESESDSEKPREFEIKPGYGFTDLLQEYDQSLDDPTSYELYEHLVEKFGGADRLFEGVEVYLMPNGDFGIGKTGTTKFCPGVREEADRWINAHRSTK